MIFDEKRDASWLVGGQKGEAQNKKLVGPGSYTAALNHTGSQS